MTLRTRLAVAFVAVVLVPLLVGMAVLQAVLPPAFEQREQAGLSAAGRLAATVVAQWCTQAEVVAEAAGRAAADPDPDTTQAALESFVDRDLADGVRVDVAGRTFSAGSPPDGAVADCSAGVATVRAGRVSVGASIDLVGPAGPPLGTAVAVVDVGEDAAALLRNAVGRGTVALVSDGQPVVAGDALSPDLVRRALEAQGSAVSGDGSLALAVAARPGQPLGVVVAQAESGGVGLLPGALAVLLGAVLLAGVIALLLARATTRPLGELGEAAARIAGGDLTSQLTVRSRDEVGRLAEAFNDMTADLRRYIGALETGRDELHAGLARLGDTLSSTHDLERILAVVLETAVASTQAEAGGVLLLEQRGQEVPGTGMLRLAVGRGLEERGAEPGFRLPVGLGIAGRVVQDGEPLRGWVGDRLPSGPGEPRAESVLAVPLLGSGFSESGAVLGVLVLYDRPGGFDDTDLVTIRGFAGQATVAIDNVLLHEEAQTLSVTDGLTGLWNYRYFTMTLDKEIERAARFARPLALIMLDLDRFKDVNDRFGHQRGDAILLEVAERLRQQVRDVDTLARYGGEEIVLILPETGEEGAGQTAERLCHAVRSRPFEMPGEPSIWLTLSIGAAVYPLHGGSATALLRRADAALYDAKRAGRDTWRLAGGTAAQGVQAHPPPPERAGDPH